jgi:CBS-domain-containing membrane protein
MLVNEIMTRNCVTITQDKTIHDAASLMLKYHIHGVPVVDENKILVGIVTETDFVIKDKTKARLDEFVRMAKEQKTPEEGAEKAEIITVMDIMSWPCITVGPDYSVEDLMPLFVEKKFPTVPVIGSDNRLVGIVTVSDVVRLFNL